MPYNISAIRAAIDLGGGIARSNRYVVYINSTFNRVEQVRFSALIDKAEFPGKSFMTTERKTYGPIRKIPYLTQYQDMTINILCTANMGERKFFDEWQNQIINVNSGYATYYDEYVSSIIIFQLNEQHIPTFAIKLEEAYPSTVAAQPVSYDGDGGALSLGVTFTYHKWRNMYQMYDDTGSGAGGRSIWQEPESPILDPVGNAPDTSKPLDFDLPPEAPPPPGSYDPD